MVKSFRIMAAMALTALAAQGAPAADNPLARGIFAAPAAPAPIEGTWNGTDLERRSACTHPENEGNRGTYAQFEVSTNAATRALFVWMNASRSLLTRSFNVAGSPCGAPL